MRHIKFWSILLVLVTVCLALPVNVAYAADYSTISVRLDSMNKPTSVNVKVEGSYVIESAPNVSLVAGTSYLITAGDSQMYIWINGGSVALGSSFTMKGIQGNMDAGLGLLVTNPSYGSIRYLGDMKYTASGGSISMVNALPMETYLYGVVAHEMSNDWPLEALKAQAVAARTYAILRSSSLGDTASYQVYKGYNRSHTNVMTAVNATAGMVMTHQGILAQAYYAASNGGQTDTATEAWGNAVPYTTVKADPYDLANPSSVVNTLTLTNTGGGPITALYATNLYQGNCPTYNVYNYIKEKATATAAINNLGQFEITNISNLRVATGSANGTVMTSPTNLNSYKHDFYLLLDVTLTGTTSITTTISFFHRELEILNGGRSTRLLSIQQAANGSFQMVNRRYGHGVGMSQRGAQEMARSHQMTYQQILEFYYPGTALVSYATGATLQLPSDSQVPSSTANTGTGGDLSFKPIENSNEAKITTQTSLYTKPDATSSARKTLAVGAVVTVFVWSDWVRLSDNESGWEGYVPQSCVSWPNAPALGGNNAPTATNTPVSTPPPVTDPATPAASTATVNVSSTLNLRGGPGTNYVIVGSMPRGATVTVLESGAWCKVTYGATTGYAMAQYLSMGAVAPSNNTPAASGTTMVVNTQSGRLNVRASGSTNGAVVGSLARGDQVTVLQSGTWAKVQAGNLTGYVMSSYLISGGTNAPAPSGSGTTANKSGTVTASSLAVRLSPGTSGKILTYLSRGTVIGIFGTSGSWYEVNHNGTKAYVHMNYVK